MLLELRAENYAVIDQAVASFGPGLNLLTGETGAGKSDPDRRACALTRRQGFARCGAARRGEGRAGVRL